MTPPHGGAITVSFLFFSFIYLFLFTGEQERELASGGGGGGCHDSRGRPSGLWHHAGGGVSARLTELSGSATNGVLFFSFIFSLCHTFFQSYVAASCYRRFMLSALHAKQL